jgi:hypothetical protein
MESLRLQLEKKKMEKEEMKRKRAEEKAAKRREERKALELLVLSDPWTQDEQILFENALLENTPNMDKYDRWANIAAAVPGKSPNQCLLRYKFIKELVLLRSNNAENEAQA